MKIKDLPPNVSLSRLLIWDSKKRTVGKVFRTEYGDYYNVHWPYCYCGYYLEKMQEFEIFNYEYYKCLRFSIRDMKQPFDFYSFRYINIVKNDANFMNYLNTKIRRMRL